MYEPDKNNLNEVIVYIQSALGQRDLLEALAEECLELSAAVDNLGKAALKIIRANGMNDNPTPVSPQEAMKMLMKAGNEYLEETIDVGIVYNALFYGNPNRKIYCPDDMAKAKWNRWVDRILARKQAIRERLQRMEEKDPYATSQRGHRNV